MVLTSWSQQHICHSVVSKSEQTTTWGTHIFTLTDLKTIQEVGAPVRDIRLFGLDGVEHELAAICVKSFNIQAGKL